MSFNLPNPALLGVLLVISTHNGPALVFKYPQNIAADLAVSKPADASESELDNDHDEYTPDSSDCDASSSDSDDNRWNSRHSNFYSGTKKNLLEFLDDQERHRRHKDGPKLEKYDSSHILKKSMSHVSDAASKTSKSSTLSAKIEAVSSTICGIEQDYLCEMLCPPREMCNSRFEIAIDDFVFLGLPIHSFDNGLWRRKKAKSTVETDEESKQDENGKSSLNMFHLVFLMNPPVIERNYRIDEMYHYVVSRLSLVLRYEQAKHDYVGQQVRLISKLREDFKAQNIAPLSLAQYLTDKSSLCKLIADCYSSISSSQIANLSINNKLRSFQIPVKTEFHSLPESIVPYLPGSHLSSTVDMVGRTGLINVGETTRYGVANTLSMIMGGTMLGGGSSSLANDFNDDMDGEDTDSSANDIIYFALLLLDEPETIIKDIRAEPDSVLSSFIRVIKPTESLLKLSHKLKAENDSNLLSLSQIQSFAFHLIYWRRARVIPPLNTKSVYIVSPMAPITINMYNDLIRFKKQFPALPSLPQLLKLLSAPSKKPRQFASVIPSKDHKDVYLSALGWMVRFGYVTQLHTYIWLKISRKIKMQVEEDLENEASLNTKNKRVVSKKAKVSGTDNTSKVDPKFAKKNTDSVPNSLDTDIAAIAENMKDSKLGPDVILEEEEDTIILDPGRATTLERKWIHKIVSEECKLSPELVQMFYGLLKYMNGKTSLELLLLKENISRNDFRNLLQQIDDHIISVRHW